MTNVCLPCRTRLQQTWLKHEWTGVHIYVSEPTKHALVLSFNPNKGAPEKNAVSIWLIRKNIWSKKDFEESAQGQISFFFMAPLRFSCSGLNHLSPTNYLIRQRKCLIHWGHFIIRREHYRIPEIKQIWS